LVRIGVLNQSVFKGYTELSESLRKFDSTKVPMFGIKHLNLKKESKKIIAKKSKDNNVSKEILDSIPDTLSSVPFAHLHNNTQFSVLQSTSRIGNLVNKAGDNNMSAIAITDRGNMMGCFHFIKAIKNYNTSINLKKIEVQ
jgi:DNA polymerase-3 subunit alpha